MRVTWGFEAMTSNEFGWCWIVGMFELGLMIVVLLLDSPALYFFFLSLSFLPFLI